MTPDHRSAWTDDRLDERMTSIDRTFELLQQDSRAIREELHDLRHEMQAMRSDLASEMRLLRSDFTSLRSDFTSLQGRLGQVGFALVGLLLATLCSLVIAVA
jgi:chromosome segregation ATPase